MLWWVRVVGNSNTQLTQSLSCNKTNSKTTTKKQMLQGETEGKIQGFDTDIEGETIKEANPDVQKAIRLF